MQLRYIVSILILKASILSSKDLFLCSVEEITAETTQRIVSLIAKFKVTFNYVTLLVI